MGRVAVAEIPLWFRQQMSRLIGLKFAPSDMTTHWEALHDMPEALLDAAVTKAQQETSEFPTPKMLRVYADQVRARVFPVPEEEPRGVELDAPVALGTLPTGLTLTARRTWRYYCEECSDSGWRSVWCGDVGLAKPWQAHGVCGRRREHGSHEFVVPCPCASSNPDVQRKLERGRQGGTRGGERD